MLNFSRKFRKNVKGSVLFTVICVMSVALVFTLATIIVVMGIQTRSYNEFKKKQAFYTARSAMDSFIETIRTDSDAVKFMNNIPSGAIQTGTGQIQKLGTYEINLEYMDTMKTTLKVEVNSQFVDQEGKVTAYLIKDVVASSPVFENAVVSLGPASISQSFSVMGDSCFRSSEELLNIGGSFTVAGTVYNDGCIKIFASNEFVEGIDLKGYSIISTKNIHLRDNANVITSSEGSYVNAGRMVVVNNNNGIGGGTSKPVDVYAYEAIMCGVINGGVYITKPLDGSYAALPDSTINCCGGTCIHKGACTGSLIIRGDHTPKIKGDVYVEGDLIVEKDIEITGNLYVGGNLIVYSNVNQLKVNGTSYVKGNITQFSMNNMPSESFKDLYVGGYINATNLVANNIYCANSVSIEYTNTPSTIQNIYYNGTFTSNKSTEIGSKAQASPLSTVQTIEEIEAGRLTIYKEKPSIEDPNVVFAPYKPAITYLGAVGESEYTKLSPISSFSSNTIQTSCIVKNGTFQQNGDYIIDLTANNKDIYIFFKEDTYISNCTIKVKKDAATTANVYFVVGYKSDTSPSIYNSKLMLDNTIIGSEKFIDNMNKNLNIASKTYNEANPENTDSALWYDVDESPFYMLSCGKNYIEIWNGSLVHGYIYGDESKTASMGKQLNISANAKTIFNKTIVVVGAYVAGNVSASSTTGCAYVEPKNGSIFTETNVTDADGKAWTLRNYARN